MIEGKEGEAPEEAGNCGILLFSGTFGLNLTANSRQRHLCI